MDTQVKIEHIMRVLIFITVAGIFVSCSRRDFLRVSESHNCPDVASIVWQWKTWWSTGTHGVFPKKYMALDQNEENLPFVIEDNDGESYFIEGRFPWDTEIIMENVEAIPYCFQPYIRVTQTCLDCDSEETKEVPSSIRGNQIRFSPRLWVTKRTYFTVDISRLDEVVASFRMNYKNVPGDILGDGMSSQDDLGFQLYIVTGPPVNFEELDETDPYDQAIIRCDIDMNGVVDSLD